MPVHQPIYNSQVNNAGTASPGRGLTPALWRNIDIAVKDPSYGFVYINDFLGIPHQHASAASGEMIVTVVTAGTALADRTVANGVLKLDTGGTATDSGVNVQFTGPGIIATAGQTVAFEARVKLEVGDDAPKWLVGLAEVDTALMGTTDIGTVDDWAVFYGLNNLAGRLAMRTAAGTADEITDVKTMVHNTWTKLGYRVVVGKSVEAYVDGQLVSTSALDNDKFPDSIVFPSFVIENANSGGAVTRSYMSIDWFGVGHIS